MNWNWSVYQKMGLALIMVFAVSCQTAEEPEQEEIAPPAPIESEQIEEAAVSKESEEVVIDYPDWVQNPPLEEGVVYGVGNGTDQSKALLASIMDISWQLQAQIGQTVLNESTADEEFEKTVSAELDMQISNASQWEAKGADEFYASDEEVWILSSMPIGDALDIAQSILISYADDLSMNEEDIVKLISLVEKQIAIERIDIDS